MLDFAKNSLSLEGEGRVRVFDLLTNPQPAHPLTSILSPPGRRGVAF
jgi:hypothetical protein